jgi:predicted nucleotidyltransferase
MSDFINDHKCVTHHHACDCREAHFKQLKAENEKLREAIKKALPSISRAMGNYEEARYIDISVLYDARVADVTQKILKYSRPTAKRSRRNWLALR